MDRNVDACVEGAVIMAKLRDVLGEYAGKTLLTIEVGGNHGDTLIYRGMHKLLEEMAIETVRLADARIPLGNRVPDDVPRPVQLDPTLTATGLLNRLKYLDYRLRGGFDAVLIQGGGNFNEMWKGGIRCYTTAARFFDCPLIVGPQSVQFEQMDPATVFEGISNPTHFFCREEYSFDMMQEAASRCSGVEVGLAEDSAFHLTPEDLPVNQSSEEYTLLAFRNNQESIQPRIEEPVEPPILVRDVSIDEETFDGFVEAIGEAAEIYTDRLHVSILASILDTPVTLYENAYHKNRGVYEFSLADDSNVTLRRKDTPPAG